LRRVIRAIILFVIVLTASAIVIIGGPRGMMRSAEPGDNGSARHFPALADDANSTPDHGFTWGNLPPPRHT
jgi:hypothetical protein